MNLPTQPYKGSRDFYPEDKRFQKYMFSVLRNTAESFGYEEYDAPILELQSLFAAKTGEEIVNHQTYMFTDRGGREVAIRPEMTPSVSRMVAAKRNQLTYPLRLYSIPNLWRYERPQKGRFREHWQLNVDIFGEDSLDAEIEMIQIADQIFKNFGANSSMYEIRLSSRKFIDLFLKEELKLDRDKALKLIKIIDKKDKLEPSEFKSALLEIVNEEQSKKVENLLEASDISSLNQKLRESEPIKELEKLISTLKSDLNITNAVFSPSLVRGFDYYTDIVFEVYDTDPDNNRSMMGGGRYDGLVELFGVEKLPVVGFGLGDATLSNFLEVHNLTPNLEAEVNLAVLTIGDVYIEASPIIEKLRQKGLNVAVDFSDRKAAAKIKWAISKKAPYIVFIGSQELANNKFKLKALKTEQESTVDLDQLIAKLKS